MGQIFKTKTEFKVIQVNGLGDLVAKVAQVTGADKVYKAITNKPINEECTPCEERRKALNESKLSKLMFKNEEENAV